MIDRLLFAMTYYNIQHCQCSSFNARFCFAKVAPILIKDLNVSIPLIKTGSCLYGRIVFHVKIPTL